MVRFTKEQIEEAIQILISEIPEVQGLTASEIKDKGLLKIKKGIRLG